MKHNFDESTSRLVKKAARLFERNAMPYLKDKINHAYTPFLVQLWQQDGQTQAALHKKIGIEQPTAVRTLDRMERDQLIKRVRSETDRREVKIFLTEKAREVEELVTHYAMQINACAVKNMSKQEKETLHQLLKKVIANLEQND